MGPRQTRVDMKVCVAKEMGEVGHNWGDPCDGRLCITRGQCHWPSCDILLVLSGN